MVRVAEIVGALYVRPDIFAGLPEEHETVQREISSGAKICLKAKSTFFSVVALPKKKT